MLKELFDAMTEQSAKAITPTVLQNDCEPGDVYYLCVPGEKPERVLAEPAPRDYVAKSVTALASVVSDWIDTDAPAVWFDRTKVFAYRDETKRRDKIVCPLTFTRQLQCLQRLDGSAKWLDQKGFIRLLRIDLYGCLEQEQALVPNLRRVKFSAGSSGTGVVLAQKASLTKEMQAELTTDAGEIQEWVNVDIQVFEDPAFRAVVKCALEINPESNTPFALVPLAGEIERAIRSAEAEVGILIAQAIGDKEVPVYYGCPNS